MERENIRLTQTTWNSSFGIRNVLEKLMLISQTCLILSIRYIAIVKLWLFWKCFPKNFTQTNLTYSRSRMLETSQNSIEKLKLFSNFPWLLRAWIFRQRVERKIRIWFSMVDLCCVSKAEHRVKSYRLNWKSSNAETRVKRKPTKQFPALCCWCWHSRSATPLNRQGCVVDSMLPRRYSSHN